MTQCFLQTESDKDPVACGNCDWKGISEDLDIVSDIEERLSPGSIVPAGECPDCGALAYLSKPHRYSEQFKCEALDKETIRIVTELADAADNGWEKSPEQKAAIDKLKAYLVMAP